MAMSIRKRLKAEQNPLIDAEMVTFTWLGDNPPALEGDFTGWEEGKAVEMVEAEPGIWTYQISIPRDAYIEYSFVRGAERVVDPYNRRTTPNGVGGYNHYFHMPEYKPTRLARNKSDIPHGTVTKVEIPTNSLLFGKKRIIQYYKPPVEAEVPLVVVWDGQDYLKRMHLNIMIDNLIAERRIQPIALAFVNNGGQDARVIEYSCGETTLGFLLREVIPRAKEHLNLIDTNKIPGAYGVVGASMGGLMALYTGARLPQIFGNVLSQSGAFTISGFDMVVHDLLFRCGNVALKVWMDVGKYDIPELIDANRRMHALLSQNGYKVSYREYHGGHNYPAWRDEIGRGLEYLFGLEPEEKLPTPPTLTSSSTLDNPSRGTNKE